MYSSVMLVRRVIAIVALALLPLAGTASPSSATSKTPVSVQVKLNTTTIRAGHSIHGIVILTNSSSKSILVEGFNCNQWLFVGIASKQVAYDPAVATSACPNSVTLKPGMNRVPITVSTKYDVCGGGAQKGTIQVPHCAGVGKRMGMPALPRGVYHVVVLTNGLPQFAPYVSRVRVTLS
jgi:hypothetical protein